MKLGILLGIFLLSPYVYADMVQLYPVTEVSSDTDSIGELTKTLDSGSYSHPDDMDIPASQDIKVSVSKQDEFIPLNNASIAEKYGRNYSQPLQTSRYVAPLWIRNCNKDRFDNTKLCYIRRDHIMVGISQGSYIVMIYADHYPRSKSALKIDNNATVYGVEGVSSSAANVIQQMKAGNVLYTRYRVWPQNYNVDSEIDLTGFTVAFNEMLAAYKRL